MKYHEHFVLYQLVDKNDRPVKVLESLLENILRDFYLSRASLRESPVYNYRIGNCVIFFLLKQSVVKLFSSEHIEILADQC